MILWVNTPASATLAPLLPALYVVPTSTAGALDSDIARRVGPTSVR